MKFKKKIITLLEGEMVEDNFILLTPMEYSDVLIRSPILDFGKKKHIEWYKVIGQKKSKWEDFLPSNIKLIKDELVLKIPDEVLRTWEKAYLVNGRDIMYKYGIEQGESNFEEVDMYKVLYPRRWDKSDLFQAYLKPLNLSKDVKDVFSDFYTEIV
jgi:hypothetical protein